MSDKSFKNLQKFLSQIEANIPNKDMENPEISKSTIGWQLDHALKVLNTVISAIEASNPDAYKPSFNLTRMYIFLIGTFPRGKVKAPKKVISENMIISEKNLTEQLNKAKNGLEITKNLDKHAFFKHHIFGVLSKKQTLQFLELHTNHHLKIINDIIIRTK